MEMPMKRVMGLMLAMTIGLTAVALAEKDADGPAVTIKEMKFSPRSLTIKIGQTVTWTNADSRDHTVVADDGTFQSENLGKGDSFSHTFKDAGKFPYVCSYHPRMKGQIIVEK
jgi:plastocyanin